jgi:hypothetical protein
MIFLGIVSFSNAYADEATGEALQKTQECLRNGTCETMNSKEGKAADDKALNAVGGDQAKKKELYNISADIMPWLTEQAKGDPSKMQEILLKAQTDPEGFFNSLPADVRGKISGTANAVGNDRAPAANP